MRYVVLAGELFSGSLAMKFHTENLLVYNYLETRLKNFEAGNDIFVIAKRFTSTFS